MKGPKAGEPLMRWSAEEEANLIIWRRIGRSYKAMERMMPGRSASAIAAHAKKMGLVNMDGKDTVLIALRLKLPRVIRDYFAEEARGLGMTLSRYIRERLVGGRP